MQIQRPSSDVPRRLTFKAPDPSQPTPPPGEHHHHGIVGTLLHVGHDVAMVGMSFPSNSGHPHDSMNMDSSICRGGQAAPDPHAGHHTQHSPAPDPHAGHHHQHSPAPDPHAGHHHGTGTDWLSTGTAVMSGAVAVGAAIHGMQMLSSKDRFTQLEGANHLLMSASCGVMAGAMLAPQSGLAPFSAPFMAAHGIGEVALGAYQVSKGIQQDCQGHKLAGALKVAHGGCLAAAQFFPGAALPLYLGMAAATAAQLSLQKAGLSH